MAANEVYPRSRQEDERLITRKQEKFDGGMVNDFEPSDIPGNAVPRLVNARGHQTAIKGRKGTSLFIGGELPTINASFTGVLNVAGDEFTTTVDIFEDWMVGCKIGTEDRSYSIIITSVTDAQTVSVEGKTATPTGTWTNAYLRGPLNGIYSDRETQIVYYHIGRTVYARQVGSSTWEEYTCVASDSPENTRSSLTKIEDYITIFNGSGIFVLNKYEEDHYFWAANDTTPEFKVNPTSNAGVVLDPSSYYYSYTFMRIKGNYNENRNSLSTFMECETAPYFHDEDDPDKDQAILGQEDYIVDGRNTDNTVNVLNTPIEDSYYQWLDFGTGYDNFETWVNLSEEGENPFLRIAINGADVDVYFDFSLSQSMQDVVKVVNDTIKEVDNTLYAKLSDNTAGLIGFIIFNTNKEKSVTFSAVSGSSDFCLIDNGALTDRGTETSMGMPVQYLRYPLNRKDITHYGVYRTADIHPYTINYSETLIDPRIANSPETFGWIDDVPVCKVFYGTITNGVLTETDKAGNLTNNILNIKDVGNQVSIISEFTLEVTDVFNITDFIYDGGTYRTYKCDLGENTLFPKLMMFGASTIRRASVDTSGNVTVLDNGQEFDPDEQTGDIGKVMFWEDGTISTIKTVVGTNAITFDTTAKTSLYVLTDPTYRTFNDTVNDNRRAGQLSVYSLRTRFYKPLPRTDIAAYNNGNIVVANSDKGDIYYSDTNELRSMGYYMPSNQKNSTIEEGIRCIFVVNNMFTICTLNNTYTVNQSQGVTRTDDFGGFWVSLPSPVIAKHGIGTTKQYKVTNGPDGNKIVATNEPAIRIFNGFEYGENMAEGAIQQLEIQRLSNNMIIDYDSIAGLHIWGKRTS